MKAQLRRRKSVPRVADRIISGLKELSDTLASGVPLEKRFSVRTVTIPDPGVYTASRIKEIRKRLGLSQALFGRMMGVSAKLVEHWERGIRTPAAPVRRLLDEMNTNPDYWRAKLRAA